MQHDKTIKECCANNPDLRFEQLLANLGLGHPNSFYEESQNTLEILKINKTKYNL